MDIRQVRPLVELGYLDRSLGVDGAADEPQAEEDLARQLQASLTVPYHQNPREFCEILRAGAVRFGKKKITGGADGALSPPRFK